MERKTYIFIMFVGFFLFFINFFTSIKAGFCEDYSLYVYSKQVDGISFNEGVFVYGSQKYDLPCTIDVTEGLHLINFLPDSDYIFSDWEIVSNKLRKPSSDNPNMIKISESGTLIINYKTAPSLDIEFLHPTENSLLDINENDIELQVRISYIGNGVEDVYVSLDVNGTYIDSLQTDSDGFVKFPYTKRKKNNLKFNIIAKKDGFKDTKTQMIYNYFYKLTTKPENGQIITDESCRVYVGFHTPSGPIEDTNVIFHVNNKTFETVIGGNGYCSVTIDNPNLGVNHFYAELVTEYNQVILSETINFEYYYDLKISSFNVEKEGLDNYTDPNIWLKTLVSSYNDRFSDVYVTFFVDDIARGYNFSDEAGVASFKYRLKDPSIINWYAVASKDGYVDAISNEKQFDLLANVPILEGLILSPTGYELSNHTSKVVFSVYISYSNEPVIESLVSFYINNIYMGENFTNNQGITSLSYYPVDENQFYDWQYNAQKTNYQPFNSLNQIIFYPKQLPKVSIADTYKSRNRADVGEPSIIGFKITYENSTPITKRIVELSNSVRNLTDEEGWVYFQVVNNIIGEKPFYINRIIDKNIGEIIDIKHVFVTWDKIALTIHKDKNRINVGEKVTLSVSGYYVYDNTGFIGEIFYNDTLIENIVGSKNIGISYITDNKYGLTSYESDALNVIWDRVKFKLRNNLIYKKNYLNETIIKGVYEYDNSEFLGEFKYKIPELDEYGIYTIEIIEIQDDLYGLSVFDDENLQIIYDEIVYDFKAINVSPSKIQCSLALKSKFTDTNQLFFIKINGQIYDLGDGDTLKIDFNDWSTSKRFDISIISSSNFVKSLESHVIYYENVFTYIFSLIILTSSVYNLVKNQFANIFMNKIKEYTTAIDTKNPSNQENIQKDEAPTSLEISPGIMLRRISLEDIPAYDSTESMESPDITYHGFESDFSSEKINIICIFLYIISVSYLLFNQNISSTLYILSILTGLSVSLSYFNMKYNGYKIVKTKKEYITSYIEQEKKIKSIQDTIDDLKSSNKRLFNDVYQNIMDIIKERELVKGRIDERMQEEERILNNKLNTVLEEKRDLLGNGAQELEQRLEKLERNWIPGKLSYHLIRYSDIPRVGEGRIKALESYGIKTAADFTDINVDNHPTAEVVFQLADSSVVQILGIGPKIGEALNTWRDKLESRYTEDMPNDLTIETEKIRDRYSSTLENIEQKERDLRNDLKRARIRALRDIESEEQKRIYQINLQKQIYEDTCRNMKEKMLQKILELGETFKEKQQIENELVNFENISFTKFLKTTIEKLGT